MTRLERARSLTKVLNEQAEGIVWPGSTEAIRVRTMNEWTANQANQFGFTKAIPFRCRTNSTSGPAGYVLVDGDHRDSLSLFLFAHDAGFVKDLEPYAQVSFRLLFAEDERYKIIDTEQQTPVDN